MPMKPNPLYAYVESLDGATLRKHGVKSRMKGKKYVFLRMSEVSDPVDSFGHRLLLAVDFLGSRLTLIEHGLRLHKRIVDGYQDVNYCNYVATFRDDYDCLCCYQFQVCFNHYYGVSRSTLNYFDTANAKNRVALDDLDMTVFVNLARVHGLPVMRQLYQSQSKLHVVLPVVDSEGTSALKAELGAAGAVVKALESPKPGLSIGCHGSLANDDSVHNKFFVCHHLLMKVIYQTLGPSKANAVYADPVLRGIGIEIMQVSKLLRAGSVDALVVSPWALKPPMFAIFGHSTDDELMGFLRTYSRLYLQCCKLGVWLLIPKQRQVDCLVIVVDGKEKRRALHQSVRAMHDLVLAIFTSWHQKLWDLNCHYDFSHANSASMVHSDQLSKAIYYDLLYDQHSHSRKVEETFWQWFQSSYWATRDGPIHAILQMIGCWFPDDKRKKHDVIEEHRIFVFSRVMVSAEAYGKHEERAFLNYKRMRFVIEKATKSKALGCLNLLAEPILSDNTAWVLRNEIVYSSGHIGYVQAAYVDVIDRQQRSRLSLKMANKEALTDDELKRCFDFALTYQIRGEVCEAGRIFLHHLHPYVKQLVVKYTQEMLQPGVPQFGNVDMEICNRMIEMFWCGEESPDPNESEFHCVYSLYDLMRDCVVELRSSKQFVRGFILVCLELFEETFNNKYKGVGFVMQFADAFVGSRTLMTDLKKRMIKREAMELELGVRPWPIYDGGCHGLPLFLQNPSICRPVPHVATGQALVCSGFDAAGRSRLGAGCRTGLFSPRAHACSEFDAAGGGSKLGSERGASLFSPVVTNPLSM